MLEQLGDPLDVDIAGVVNHHIVPRLVNFEASGQLLLKLLVDLIGCQWLERSIARATGDDGIFFERPKLTVFGK
ncbi:MAG: hypothetical protein R3C56_06180 [Pirellulaceae bacterium]